MMYLYLYYNQNKKKEQSPGDRGNRLNSSEELVRKALRDYCRRIGLEISDELLDNTMIEREEKGKPYFIGLQEPSIHYSVSHSGCWWGCLMADEPVGFDLEIIRDKVNYEKIAQRFFTAEECDWILSAGPEAFFEVWVRKEAYVKYLGTGLAEGLDSFTVVTDGGLSVQVVSLNEKDRDFKPCFARPCEIDGIVKAAYCCGSGNSIMETIMISSIK